MSKLEKVYQFMNRSSFNRHLVGTLVAVLLFGGFYIIGTGVFNTVSDSIARNARAAEIQAVKDASPKEYVNFYSVKVDDASLGDSPNLTLCRKLGHGTVRIDAVRTFIRDENGQQRQVAEHAFRAAIEKSITNTDCTTVDLQGQPQVIGTYRIFTDYCFNIDINGETVKKCDNYTSNQYKITDDIDQLKQRIDELKAEYDRRLSAMNSATESSGIAQSQTQSQSNAAQGVQSSGSEVASGNGNTGSSSGGSNNGNNGSTGNQSRGGITLDLPLLPPITLFGN